MLKKRLLLNLYFADDCFCISRNFRLQKVGDLSWLESKFKLYEIFPFIDELVIINRNERLDSIDAFCGVVDQISSRLTVPLTLGGNVACQSDIERYFSIGADKVVVAGLALSDPVVLEETALRYGSQAVVLGLNIMSDAHRDSSVKLSFGRNLRPVELSEFRDLMAVHGKFIGEILLTDHSTDGTGRGFSEALVEQIESDLFSHYSLVVSAGISTPSHVIGLTSHRNVSGVITSDLLSLVLGGISELRSDAITLGADLLAR